MTGPPPYAENQPYENRPYPTGYEAYPGYPPKQPTNSLAVVSLVCAFVFAPLGIVFGHMSLSQIKKSREAGRGLAIAGLVISYLAVGATIVIVVVSLIAMVVLASSLERFDARDFGSPRLETPATGQPLPPFLPPATPGSNCQYPATTEPASKPVRPPQTGRTSTNPASIPGSIETNRGDIGIALDNAKAPCTVRNFTTLAGQGFFDETQCHRLTVGPALRVLQCGDPTATGTGGPGYRFPNEYPSNQFRLSDPALKTPMVYPRGTLAMANSGAGTNGSQFFLVYDDSMLPPQYTVFGTIDADGLATLGKIAAAGTEDGSPDGTPATGVTIESVRVG
jgi:peptidyl-prolyl cis-trans isomerase B (cyclophilin B)